VVRRRPSQPTRRRLAHKQDLYRLPKETTHPHGEHPDPGSTCSPSSGTGKPALRPQRPACLTALEQRSRTITAARSAMATRQQRHPRATHRSTTDDRLPEATVAGGTPLSKRATGAPTARRCRFAASLSPAPIARHGCSAAHPAHSAGRARRVSSPVSTAGAVEASVTHALLADCTRRG
jgi:hypothetical protein